MNIKQNQNQQIPGDKITRFYLDASFQGVKRLLIILLLMLLLIQSTILIIELKETAIENIFLPRINITNYNVLIDGRNLYDQKIDDQIKNYDEVRKIATACTTQQDAFWTINTSKIIFNYLQIILANKNNQMLIQELFSKLNFMGC